MCACFRFRLKSYHQLGPTWMCLWLDPSVPTLQITHEHFAHKTRIVSVTAGPDSPWQAEVFCGKTLHEVDLSNGREDFIAMKPMLMPSCPPGQPYVNTSPQLSILFQVRAGWRWCFFILTLALTKGVLLLAVVRTCFDHNNQCRLMFVSVTCFLEWSPFVNSLLLEFDANL